MAGGRDLSREVKFLQHRLKESIVFFEGRRTLSRRAAIIARTLAAGFAALTTVLLGIKGYGIFNDTYVSIAAFGCSAAVPVLVAWETFYDPRWLWVRYNETLGALASVSDELQYAIAGGRPLRPKLLDELFSRLQATLRETNRAWADKRLKDQAADQEKVQKERAK